MIYNRPNETQLENNSCVGCDKLNNSTEIIDRTEKHQCRKYPGMDNFVRCINYTSNKTINTQTTLKTNSS